MAKWGKRLFGLAVIGSAVAGLVYYFKNNSSFDADEEFNDELEDEDFDLDNDLKPVSDREYVPLNHASKGEDENPLEDAIASTQEAVKETVADIKKEVTEEVKEKAADMSDIAADIAADMKNADFESDAK